MIDGLYRAISEQILGHLHAIERALKRISLSTDLHLSEARTSSKHLNNLQHVFDSSYVKQFKTRATGSISQRIRLTVNMTNF